MFNTFFYKKVSFPHPFGEIVPKPNLKTILKDMSDNHWIPNPDDYTLIKVFHKYYLKRPGLYEFYPEAAYYTLFRISSARNNILFNEFYALTSNIHELSGANKDGTLDQIINNVYNREVLDNLYEGYLKVTKQGLAYNLLQVNNPDIFLDNFRGFFLGLFLMVSLPKVTSVTQILFQGMMTSFYRTLIPERNNLVMFQNIVGRYEDKNNLELCPIL